ncbi:VCBS repeat-containing protein [Cellulophaga sp. E16_2]|uniref:VCBS repeat-containing protein n=1 Tax=Cellulophaga sp. E16_2 TaxID=2789297 RepID=UPI001A916CD8|nr:VCBS repeat-containing protein [Cellulophaga sp. E16_2]MBO0590175.1 VCBS repeat-containing protein [Cellulophaga sp. E16_2]
MIKHLKHIATFLRIFFIGFSFFLFSNCTSEVKEKSLFKLVTPDESGITFSNTLAESDAMNILDFEFMYNGGGVAVGDIDNDGLQDIYFSGNQVSGKLYKNLGNLKFKDITIQANVATTGWSNGVAMQDVNQDGLVDIYISRGAPRNASKEDSANLFFINQGDGTFLEVAEEYGIADTGYSIQALFFDYDKDGDNDLYLLTNALVNYNRNNSKHKIIDGSAASTDKLYRNNGDGTFSDVSIASGITIEGFGLGVAMCDINEDGWLDVYVSNDFLTNDILYINNQDGTFSDKITSYIKHQSYNGMGLNISDINNDGLSDIVVLDMLPQENKRLKQTIGNFSYDKLMLDSDFGYTPQFVRNTLQLNNGNGSFSEIGQLSGISATDWSWSPLIADFDNDGNKDIFITNGYRRDVTNLDFIVYGQQQGPFGDPNALRKDKLAKLKALPEVKLHNYVYKNNGDLTFTDKSLDWGIDEPSYSNGAAYADFDNDGDLDIVVSNIDDMAYLYQNTTITSNSKVSEHKNYLNIALKGVTDILGTKVTLYSGGHLQQQVYTSVKGYLSTVDSRLHFGLGNAQKVDSILVAWPNGVTQVERNKNANQFLEISYDESHLSKAKYLIPESPIFKNVASDLGLLFEHKENKYIDFNAQTTLLKMNSKLGPGIAVGDVNGDNLEDFYIGGGKGYNGSFFMQQPDGRFIEKIIENGEAYEDMGVLLADIDDDGDLDLIVISGGELSQDSNLGYTDRVYTNDGVGNFKENVLLERAHSGSFVKASDFDKDGDLDLFIGARYIDGSYPLAPKSYLLVNENGKFVDRTSAIFKNNGEFGMLSDALWTDFDNDGAVDLILVGEYMSPIFLKNKQGKFVDVSTATGLENVSGWWNSISSGDFDKDGDIDYVLGNLGLNSSYKATASEPITIYSKDFDNNGSIDPLTTSFRQGEEQLIHSRDVLNSQIVAMKARFRTYESYADASFEETFSQDELKGAHVLSASLLSSSYLENLGNGKFKIKQLPLAAQFAPVFGIEVQDYNNDNNLDVLLVGNLYATEALTGPYDAFSGLCLLGDGAGNFEPMTSKESGLKIEGDAKALVELQSANGNAIVLASQNTQNLMAYSYETNRRSIPVGLKDVYAIVHMKNGASYKQEFTYGNSYLSQSSRKLKVDPKETAYVELFSYSGEIKKINLEHE